MAEQKLERIYTIPLRKAYEHIRTKRTVRAVKMVRAFLAKHMKVPEVAVKLSAGLNSALWMSGMQKPPRYLKVRVVKEADKANASLLDEKIKMPFLGQAARAEEKKKKYGAKKAEAKPAEKKEPAKAEPKKEAPKPAAPAKPEAKK
jgi:large subunit ribosomal protein L31e